MRFLCRLIGHRLPRRKRPFFLLEPPFQRCERCGKRVLVRIGR